MELVPQALSTLLRRIIKEPQSHPSKPLFDLPAAKQWTGAPDGLDLSRAFHGERASTVVGPAAGPHTQLAQNIALSYLAGGRIMELKTVQILDELEIPRPCIDATNIGFNVEWSQELRISQSLDEYAKAALLLEALKRLGLPEGLDVEKDGRCLLDLSLGYDLAGIQSPRITEFIEGMKNAQPIFDRLLSELAPDVAEFRDLRPDPSLISCVTLSTFHGCPADEIEKIAEYLMRRFGLHMIVKLNPTLLGFEEVGEILHEVLGYVDLQIDRKSFDHDLQWDDALSMIGRLRGVAQQEGVTLGVKLTNTMVVENHKDFFTTEQMYLSGQPLHVLSTRLYAKLRETLPMIGPNGEPPVVYSFSAGIDQHNFPLAAAADLLPVTTCTDLLRPGGYARLPKYLEKLAAGMKRAGAWDLDHWILKAHQKAVPAMQACLQIILAEAERSGHPITDSSALEKAAALTDSGANATEALEKAGFDAPQTAVILPLWIHATGTLNARVLADTAFADPRYRQAKNDKRPKKIGSMLDLFDCINCDKCIPVCPNDANFAYEVEPSTIRAPQWVIQDGGLVVERVEPITIEKVHQLATFLDFCNGCGNCDVFCPEDGGPYNMKPHWFGGRASFEAETRLDGFYLVSSTEIAGRINGGPVRLRRLGDSLIFEDDTVELELTLDDGLRIRTEKLNASSPGYRLDGRMIVQLEALLTGVQRTINPVSAGLEPD